MDVPRKSIPRNLRKYFVAAFDCVPNDPVTSQIVSVDAQHSESLSVRFAREGRFAVR
jgi:hypothetical protein